MTVSKLNKNKETYKSVLNIAQQAKNPRMRRIMHRNTHLALAKVTQWYGHIEPLKFGKFSS